MIRHITKGRRIKNQKTTERMKPKIEAGKYYSLTWIVSNGLIPFIKAYHTAHKAVLEDKVKPKKRRTLDALIIGEGKGKTIRIKGSNLQKYLDANKERL